MEQIFNGYYTSEGIPFYNLSKSVTFPLDYSLSLYTSMYSDLDIPWTIMSYKLYGSILYWWVLSALNKKYPFYSPRGEIIKIIHPNSLKEVIKYI